MPQSARGLAIAGLICILPLVGCVPLHRYLAYPAAEADPDPTYAYLIIGSRVVPAEDGQQTWIHIRKYGGGVHDLLAGVPIYAVIPDRYEVTRVHFAQPSQSGVETRLTHRWNRFKLKPGIIYYLGTFEIADSNGKYTMRLVRDEDLFQRACDFSPEVFERFPVEYLDDDHASAPFAPCVTTGSADSTLLPRPASSR